MVPCCIKLDSTREFCILEIVTSITNFISSFFNFRWLCHILVFFHLPPPDLPPPLDSITPLPDPYQHLDTPPPLETITHQLPVFHSIDKKCLLSGDHGNAVYLQWVTNRKDASTGFTAEFSCVTGDQHRMIFLSRNLIIIFSGEFQDFSRR